MSAAELLVGLRGKKERLQRSDLEAAAWRWQQGGDLAAYIAGFESDTLLLKMATDQAAW